MSYSPWGALEQFEDIIVGYVPLPSGLSWWEPDERVILIDPSLDRVTRRCALAHELEHVQAGDAACNFTAYDDWFSDRMERRAWIRAARKLIPLDDLIHALRVHEGDDRAVAEVLDVDQLVLDVRRDTLQPHERHQIRRAMASAEDLEAEQMTRARHWHCLREPIEESA